MTRQYFRMAKAALRSKEITTKISRREWQGATLPSDPLPRRRHAVIPSADGRTAAEVLEKIRELYQALETLPCVGYSQGRQSTRFTHTPAYVALEAQIRTLSERFKLLERAPLTLVRV